VYIDHHAGGDNWHNACVEELNIGDLVRIFDAHEGFRLFPRCLFVLIPDATEAISYFFQNGGRSPKVQWLHTGSIPWAELEKETERIRNTER